MNLKLILMLCLPAAAMGFASVYGYTIGIEWLLWLILFIIYAVTLAKKLSSKLFLHGFIVSFLSNVIKALIQLAFFQSYLANNPITAEQTEGIPPGMSLQTFFLIIAPVVGIIAGIFTGLLTVIAGKSMKRNRNG